MPADRRNMRASIVIALCASWLSAGAVAAESASPCKSTVTGDLRLHELQSQVFGNTRTIRVLVPAGYDAPENRAQRYPVLYMLDGQNLFDACLSDVSHKEWQVDETVGRLTRERAIPQIIVVGIDHAREKRAYEYLPYRDFAGNPDMEEPAGKQFPTFLAKEVLPFVNQTYRTLTGLANTGLGGSSYGGVATLYALMARPDTFGYALIESPSLSIGMGQLVRDTAPLIALPRKVYIGFGGREIDNPVISQKMIDLVQQVGTNFRAAGYDDSNLRVVIDADAKHDEVAWAKRFPDAVRFLFGDWRPQ